MNRGSICRHGGLCFHRKLEEKYFNLTKDASLKRNSKQLRGAFAVSRSRTEAAGVAVSRSSSNELVFNEEELARCATT